MKIVSFESGLYQIPLTETWGSSIYQFSSLEFIIVWLKTDTGITGTGWTFTVGIGGSSIRNLIDKYLIHKVMGQDPHEVERLWSKMWLESHDIGAAGMTTHAIAALDIALWDLLAQASNEPLYRLLGACRDFLPGYGSGVNLHMEQDDLLSQIEGFLANGYKAVKMKVGRENVYEDLDRVLAVRKLVGRSVRIMVDANQRWFPHEAVYRAEILKQADIHWLEEPVLSDDIQGQAYVRQKISIPIALGESLYTKHQFAHFIRQGACDIVQPNVFRVGGVTEFMKIGRLAESHNLALCPHFGMEISIHMACSIPNAVCFEALKGASLSEMGILEYPIEPRNGVLHPSSLPGHGVRFNRNVLKKYVI